MSKNTTWIIRNVYADTSTHPNMAIVTTTKYAHSKIIDQNSLNLVEFYGNLFIFRFVIGVCSWLRGDFCVHPIYLLIDFGADFSNSLYTSSVAGHLNILRLFVHFSPRWIPNFHMFGQLEKASIVCENRVSVCAPQISLNSLILFAFVLFVFFIIPVSIACKCL